eukprot:TRINITY_DN5074_c0_g2_i1.p1 TRINITY_DN5074_c0_g2~~TRINITY_DN5074_c0_g2_i1.p1  ORF type:complete len:817 (-),score=173.72 TRINITY_DN5074_c0_g2_i1:217-2535(-)
MAAPRSATVATVSDPMSPASAPTQGTEIPGASKIHGPPPPVRTQESFHAPREKTTPLRDGPRTAPVPSSPVARQTEPSTASSAYPMFVSRDQSEFNTPPPPSAAIPAAPMSPPLMANSGPDCTVFRYTLGSANFSSYGRGTIVVIYSEEYKAPIVEVALKAGGVLREPIQPTDQFNLENNHPYIYITVPQRYSLCFQNEPQERVSAIMEHLHVGRELMIASRSDPDSCRLWIERFGIQTKRVPWTLFLGELQSYFSGDVFVRDSQFSLSLLLCQRDNHGFVTPMSFGAYLQRFGPLRGSMQRVQSAIEARWFHWNTPRTGAEALLFGHPVGTFLIRLSEDPADPYNNRFALSYVEVDGQSGRTKVHHVLIFNRNGSIELLATDGTLRYETLATLVEDQANKLRGAPADSMVRAAVACKGAEQQLKVPRAIKFDQLFEVIRKACSVTEDTYAIICQDGARKISVNTQLDLDHAFAIYDRSQQPLKLCFEAKTDPVFLELPAGCKIDKKNVELGEFIGGGGYGEVFRAKYFGADVAVKKMRHKVQDSMRMSEFYTELMVMRMNMHPNIVQLHGAFVDSDAMYLVMSFESGGSLADALREGIVEGMPMRRRVKLAKHVSCGMYFLHARHVLHRDIKPHNVLLDANHELAKIADFGLARTGDVSPQQQKSAGSAVGTYHYAAPEVLLRRAHSEASDMYSFGIMLWELVSAARRGPFPGLDAIQAALAVTERVQRPPTTGLPPPLVQLMQRCWAAEPTARPSFEQVYAELEALESQL